jgi:O-antigen ligase
MAVMSIGAAVAGLGLVVALGGPRGVVAAMVREWERNRAYRGYAWLAIALALACALSLAAAAWFPLTVAGKQPEVRFLKDMAKAWYLFWPLLLVPGLRLLGDQDRRRVVRAWLGAFAALSALGVVQYFVGWPRPHLIPGHEPYYHVVLFLGHHLSVASILIFPLFATLDLALKRRVLWGAVVLGALALFGTYSRMLWLSLPVGLFVWAVWAMPRRGKIAAGLAVLLLSLAAGLTPEVRKRFSNAMGVGTRQQLWDINLGFLRERPLTGVGWHHNLPLAGAWMEERFPNDPYRFVGHAHNNVIEVLGGTGAIGLAAWLAWCGGVLLWSWRAARKLAFGRGLVCAWIVFQLNGLTQVNFWESKVLHSMMWAVAWVLLAEGEDA